MKTVKALYDELDYWIHIGIADDIVKASAHRPEYQHLVSKLKKLNVPDDEIPKMALINLRDELKLNFVLRRTQWRLLWLSVRKTLRF